MHRQSGNILFLILIAVVLFAALSFAVTSSTRSGGGSTEKESSALAASEILNYIVGLRTAVAQMLMRGCSAEDISFYMSTIPDLADYEHSTEVRDECKVFHPDGGGVPYRDPPDSSNDGTLWVFTGANTIVDVGTSCATASCAELSVMIPNVTLAVCKEVNKKVGLTAAGAAPPEEGSSFGIVPFDGTYLGNAYVNNMDGFFEGCVNATSVNTTNAASWVSPTGAVGDVYYITAVLISR